MQKWTAKGTLQFERWQNQKANKKSLFVFHFDPADAAAPWDSFVPNWKKFSVNLLLKIWRNGKHAVCAETNGQAGPPQGWPPPSGLTPLGWLGVLLGGYSTILTTTTITRRLHYFMRPSRLCRAGPKRIKKEKMQVDSLADHLHACFGRRSVHFVHLWRVDIHALLTILPDSGRLLWALSVRFFRWKVETKSHLTDAGKRLSEQFVLCPWRIHELSRQ